MDEERQDFYFYGKQVVSAHYDPATMSLEVIYRSGKKRVIKDVAPSQLLNLISVITLKVMLLCACVEPAISLSGV